MDRAAIAIFALTYVLIANRQIRVLPIGRAAGALLGAVLMTLCGVLTPKQAYDAVDPGTIGLLFGMMVITAFLAEARILDRLAAELLTRVASPVRLLALVGVLSGVLSAVLVNDTVCLFATPVVVAVCRRAGLPVVPYLMAVATSSNIGSVATLVGNPQIMIIGSLSKIPFWDYLAKMGPLALGLLALNVALLAGFYRRVLPRRIERVTLDPVPVAAFPAWSVAIVVAGVFCAFLAGADLAWTAMAGGVALMVASRKDPAAVFADVDWRLLVFFGALFVVVRGVGTTGLAERMIGSVHGGPLYVPALLLGSNLFSNVPMVLLAAPYLASASAGGGAHEWYLLALVTTLAGNLTLIGSAANLIVAEHAELPFWTHLKFGVVSTVATLVAGVLWLGA